MPNILPFQDRFRPSLPTVMGNVDYLGFQRQLKRIDEILRVSRVEKKFIGKSLNHLAKTLKMPLEKISEKARIHYQQESRQALRCNIARLLMGVGVREFSRQLAGMPLLQWFCGVDCWGVIRVPAKSSVDRYSRWLPEEEMRSIVNQVLQSGEELGLKEALDLESYFTDTTCVKANIHYPVDWVLLRDATRTAMKAVKLIREQGLKHRMEEPGEFMNRMNRLSIQMTHTRRKENARREQKRILRLMKKMVDVVSRHAASHRDLLDQKWEETEWTRPQAEQVLKRLDNVLALLPQAKKQAHERIIGERKVKNEDKIISLYETNTNVIVRGKAGAEVEFGNTLLLGEARQGLIVDWKMWKESAPSDSRMLKGSMDRVEKGLGIRLKEVTADRGFDSEENRDDLEEKRIYNGLCPRDPKELKKEMSKKRFAKLQRRRSQTEGRIGIFKNNFLGKPLRVKGFEHRKLAVCWAVLAHNLWVLARLPQAEIKRKAA